MHWTIESKVGFSKDKETWSNFLRGHEWCCYVFVLNFGVLFAQKYTLKQTSKLLFLWEFSYIYIEHVQKVLIAEEIQERWISVNNEWFHSLKIFPSLTTHQLHDLAITEKLATKIKKSLIVTMRGGPLLLLLHIIHFQKLLLRSLNFL